MKISIVVFVIYLIIIMLAQIHEFRNYVKRLNVNPLVPKRRLKPKIYDAIDTDENFLIVQTKTGKVIQIIKGRKSLYFHYLEVNTKNGEICKDSLITDYTDIDEVKKYNPKDYRINYVSLKKVTFSVEQSVTKIGVLNIRLKNQEKIFYPVSDVSKDKFENIFSNSKSSEYSLNESFKRVTPEEVLKNLDKQKIFFIILRTVTLIFGGAIFIFINHTSFSVHRILVTAFISGQLAIMIFYCFHSDKFKIRDLKKYETGKQNIYSKETNISTLILIFSSVTLIIGISPNILSWGKYLLISLAVSAGLSAVLILFADYDDRKASILPAVMIALFFSFGTVGTVNYMYDISEPIISESEIYDKYKTTGKSTSYYFTVTISSGEKESLSVSYDDYNSAETGDIVKVYESGGLLGIPYAEVIMEYD